MCLLPQWSHTSGKGHRRLPVSPFTVQALYSGERFARRTEPRLDRYWTEGHTMHVVSVPVLEAWGCLADEQIVEKVVADAM